MTDANPAPPALAPNDHLTSAEQRLIEAATSGRVANVVGESLRADVLRTLITGTRADWRLTPVGLNLTDAAIIGQLDLEGCQSGVPLVFQRCRFGSVEASKAAVVLRDALLKRVAFYECRFDGDLKADRAIIETALFLSRSHLTGMLRLRGARIGEALAMDDVRVEHADKTAILADGLRLDGPWILRGAEIDGDVRFANARLASALLWEAVKIRNSPVAIIADEAACESPWLLRRSEFTGAIRLRGATFKAIDAQQIVLDAASEGFNARGAIVHGDVVLDGVRLSGGLHLSRARIDGELTAKGAVITATGNDWAIGAAGVEIGQGLSLSSAKLTGGLALGGARIAQGVFGPNLSIAGQGRAIDADTIHVGGNWVMRGAEFDGSLRIAGARIEGQLALTECKIRGGDLAIRADGVRIDGGWFMGRATLDGLVRLPSARLGNEMRLRGTTITVASGPALYANGASIPRELVLDGGFTTTGGIILDGAEIDGALDVSGSRIRSAAWGRNGPLTAAHKHDEVMVARYDTAAISLVDARIDRLIMPEHAADRPVGIVDLSRARVGSYEDHADAWPLPLRLRMTATPAPDHLVLDGFVYDHLETPTGVAPGKTAADVDAARMRTRWLEGQSRDDLERHFKPHAWLHVTSRLAAQGYHDDARAIAIARRRRHRASASVTRGARLQDWLLDVFALYGFNPWRTVTWMAAFVLLFAGIWGWAARGCIEPTCKDETVFVMALKGNYGQDDAKSVERYPAFSPLAYSLDVFLPFVNFGYEDHWRPRTDHVPITKVPIPGAQLHGIETISLTLGGILYALTMVEMVLGLALASLAVTAFAGLLRSDEEPRA